MKFKFSLQSILDLEEANKKNLEANLSELKIKQTKVETEMKNKIEQLNHKKLQESKGVLNINDFKNHKIFVSNLCKHISILKEKYNIYQKEVDRFIKLISFKSEKIKKLEKMKKKQYDNYKKKIELKEEKRLEDFIGARKYYKEKYEKEA